MEKKLIFFLEKEKLTRDRAIFMYIFAYCYALNKLAKNSKNSVFFIKVELIDFKYVGMV